MIAGAVRFMTSHTNAHRPFGHCCLTRGGQPDDYVPPGFCTSGYEQFIDGLPGEWPYLFRLEIKHPTDLSYGVAIAEDWYIAKIAIEAPDGEW